MQRVPLFRVAESDVREFRHDACSFASNLLPETPRRPNCKYDCTNQERYRPIRLVVNDEQRHGGYTPPSHTATIVTAPRSQRTSERHRRKCGRSHDDEG
jgi:hypothetical protein